MKLSMIVVVGKNREIGCNNQLLWDIPEDMARFKKITTGHTVIMGSKTFESMNSKPLPGRNNIVIDFNKGYNAPGCAVVNSIEEAVERAEEQEKNGEAFVIGGGSIYEQFLPKTDKLYITVVDDAPKADTYFPDYSDFKNIEFEEIHEKDNLKFTFYELSR